MGLGVEIVESLFDAAGIETAERCFRFGERVLDLLLVGIGKFLATFLEQFFHLVNGLIERVLVLEQFLALFVFGFVGLGLFDLGFDVILGKAGAAGQRDAGVLARGLVLGRDMHDAVGVNVENHLDLRHAAGSGRQATQVEVPQEFVALNEWALALEYFDVHAGLIVHCGGVDF